MAQKRLFFGLEALTPPLLFPSSGRRIERTYLHVTLSFLGNIEAEPLEKIIDSCPPFPYKVGFPAICNQLLFLPSHHPNVVAFQIEEYAPTPLSNYRRQVIGWLKKNNYPPDPRPYLPHLTMARQPFNANEWHDFFSPFPIILTNLHLYESVGHLTYEKRWSRLIAAPFEEFEHTADIAFKIRGESMKELHLNAFTALSWRSPSFLSQFSELESSSLDDMIIDLNHKISLADMEGGTPFKAISFHGDVRKTPEGLLEWEMIVDV
jgi:RNA 2',3'-cyclic 3'-phosphodiesterase